MKNLGMNWIKYRHNWSSGNGDWVYKSFMEDCSLDEESLIDLGIIEDVYEFDQYRGVDIEKVEIKDVPLEVIEKELKIVKENINYFHRKQGKLCQDLVKVEQIWIKNQKK